jgi:hypothetical protein
MAEKGKAKRVLKGEPEGKISLGIYRCWSEDNI